MRTVEGSYIRTRAAKRACLGALCAAALMLGAAPAQGAAADPLFVFPSPPTGLFEGPCGLAVDTSGRFYVSDYYHHAVDVFTPPASPFTSPPSFVGQLAGADPLDGPCGLAFDATNHLYLNDYHRNVARFNPAPSFGGGIVIAGAPLDSSRPTGVAVDPATGYVYVDERTYVAVYESSGAPVEEGGEALKIGLGDLEDGYGLAVSGYSGTEGYLYVPDAATDTVKVYDPAALDKVDPVEVIDGHDIFPNAGFVSLRDAAVAVSRASGKVYVADDTQPEYTESPQATIYVFDSAGAYLGHLKYSIVDALPPGLAVDNSPGITQGRVYVTSGNTSGAVVYAYPPGAETTLPLQTGAFGQTSGAGAAGEGAIECASACGAQIRSGAGLEAPLSSSVAPSARRRAPRRRAAHRHGRARHHHPLAHRGARRRRR